MNDPSSNNSNSFGPEDRAKFGVEDIKALDVEFGGLGSFASTPLAAEIFIV